VVGALPGLAGPLRHSYGRELDCTMGGVRLVLSELSGSSVPGIKRLPKL
jgi:hypothetical protein